MASSSVLQNFTAQLPGFAVHTLAMMAAAHLSVVLADAYGFAGIVVSIIIKTSLVVLYFTLIPKIFEHEKTTHEHNSCENLRPSFLLTNYLPMVLWEAVVVKYLLTWDHLITSEGQDEPLWVQYVYCIPKSLLFEVAFDFFYYWIHRLFHSNKFLYKLVHEDHHEHDKPGPLSTYKMTMLEVLSTVTLPSFLSFMVCGLKYTPYQLQVVLAFRTSGEIAGHSGLTGDHWRCFQQFPFCIPSSLCLRIRDHDLHHSRLTMNYSKRFLLWDVLFGTYDSLEAIEEKRFRRRLNVRVHVMGLMRRISTIVVSEKSSRRATVLNPIGIDDANEGKNYKSSASDGAGRKHRSASVMHIGSSVGETQKDS